MLKIVNSGRSSNSKIDGVAADCHANIIEILTLIDIRGATLTNALLEVPCHNKHKPQFFHIKILDVKRNCTPCNLRNEFMLYHVKEE